MDKLYTKKEVEELVAKGEKLIIFDGKVYDVSYFNNHPGGQDKLERFNGKDASAKFKGHSEKALKFRESMAIAGVKVTPTELKDAGDKWKVIEG